jgi:uroporphyrinogen decarboxylase
MDFPPLLNDNILRAAKGLPVDRIPVWAMRQAGRYLPEYREFQKDKDFFGTCRTPAWACAVTLQPVDRFDLDAAILFSDILVVPQALGMEVLMVPAEGPVFPKPLRSPADWTAVAHRRLEALGLPPLPDPAGCAAQLVDHAPRLVSPALDYVFEAMTLTRHRLNGRVPLIGFAGSPWTVFVYMTEGRSSRLFSECRKWLYTRPTESDDILRVLTHMTAEYLIRQAKAGAQLLQVFDSHGGVLCPKLWRRFSLPSLLTIATLNSPWPWPSREPRRHRRIAGLRRSRAPAPVILTTPYIPEVRSRRPAAWEPRGNKWFH